MKFYSFFLFIIEQELRLKFQGQDKKDVTQKEENRQLYIKYLNHGLGYPRLAIAWSAKKSLFLKTFSYLFNITWYLIKLYKMK